MINKNKIYVRRDRCVICREDVYAIYNIELKRWVLKCKCGEDSYFEKINKRNFKKLLGAKK